MLTLVLSGGGIKGLAHVGALRALEERGIEPDLVIGTSIGSLVGAAWATGMRLREMEDRALALRRRDILRIAHMDMALRRMLSPAVYRRDPLDQLLDDLVGRRTFRDLGRRLLVNTADLNTGHQILWGLPHLDDARVADAVYASCSLPGLLPPRRIRGRVCVDGAVIDNMPVRAAAAIGGGPVIAMDLGGGLQPRRGVERRGFAAIYGRGFEMVMGRLVESTLAAWNGQPLVIIRPAVREVQMFAFNRTPLLIAEGYRAVHEALDRLPGTLDQLPAGLYPVRPAQLAVDRARCVGCRLCVGLEPAWFRMEGDKAVVAIEPGPWTPRADMVARACPVSAITVGGLEPARARTPH